jgi:hypothetical protein
LEGYDGYDPNNYTLPPTPSVLPTPTPGVTPASTPSPTPGTLDTIQKFIITRSNFSDSINEMIVFLSAKNNYQDLILKLSKIQANMNNL